jgi:gliding motility-associated-like protein
MREYVLFLLLSFYTGFSLSAQFLLNGDAVQLDAQCYQLTPAVNWKVGSIWNPDKIDLSRSFDLVMELFLGCADAEGADGIVFGLQPVSTTVGLAGGGIGFGGVAPSFGIEIDTYQNTILSDPPFDHLAMIRNGELDHTSTANTLAGPVQANINQANIEDCQPHDLRVSWDADTQRMEVYFDCEERLTFQGDIVTDIFGGDPLVFWGFTAATGGLNNQQQVCFAYTTFLDELPDVVMCPGGQVRLAATGGVRYEWTPTTGLSDPTAAQPMASPDTTTTYTVKIFDSCERPFFDEVTVTVAGDLVSFDLGPDTTLCAGESLLLDASTPAAIYNWNTGTSGADYTVREAGLYSVTVTRTDIFCIAEDFVTVNYRPLPVLDIGPDSLLCQDQVLTLKAGFPEAEVEWSNGSRQDSFLVSRPGTYFVSLEHPCGSLTDQVIIDYEDCREIFLPNVFSPNLDGINDNFFPMDGGDVIQVDLFQVYDRWGGLLFEQTDFPANDANRGWNGRSRDQDLPAGTYVWVLEVTFRDGPQTLAGSVLLLR